MSQFNKFNAEVVLTDPSLSDVYRSMTELAKEFAVLGFIATAKTLVSLLLSEYSSEWQLSQFRFLRFAFAEVNEWPEQICPPDRTEDALGKIQPQLTSNLGDIQDNSARLQKLLEHAKGSDASTGGAAMDRSSVLADALALAIQLASRQTSSIEEIEADARVQQVLGLIAKRMHANQMIQYLTERRANWPLLSRGALARAIPVDIAKVKALAEEAIATFTQRFKNGRKAHVGEDKSIKYLLGMLDRNTKAHSIGHYAAMGDDVPESLFQPGATDQQISAVERTLDVTLPDDYKEFLKISNGFGGTWNGFYVDPPLSSTEDIGLAGIYVDDLPIELHDSPTGNLQLKLIREWPSYEKALELSSEDILDVWLLPPGETKRVLVAYQEAMGGTETPENVKRQTMKQIESTYGSWEAFQKLEWVVLEMQEGQSAAFGSFAQLLAERVRRSAMGSCEEDKMASGCFAYTCMDEKLREQL